MLRIVLVAVYWLKFYYYEREKGRKT